MWRSVQTGGGVCTDRCRCVQTGGGCTYAVAGLPADGSSTLDVGPGGGHVVVPPQLRKQVFNQVDEHQVTTGHHQVA